MIRGRGLSIEVHPVEQRHLMAEGVIKIPRPVPNVRGHERGQVRSGDRSVRRASSRCASSPGIPMSGLTEGHATNLLPVFTSPPWLDALWGPRPNVP